MSTEYTFDGLDEWEKNLAQVIDQQYPEEFKQMVIDIAERTLGRAKELTPVQTGHLRNAWNLGTIEKRGDTYYIEIYNNVEYAEPVEYGHRMKGGGFKKGAHMLEVSLQEMDRMSFLKRSKVQTRPMEWNSLKPGILWI